MELILPTGVEKADLRRCKCIRTRRAKIVRPLVDEWHSLFSYSPPGFRLAFLMLDEDDIAIAAAMWGRPVARLEDQEKTLELSRLAHGPRMPRNGGTWFLGQMRHYIRKEMPQIERLISYQDNEAHTGALYKADNWILLDGDMKRTTGWKNRETSPNGKFRGSKSKWERRP